MRDYTSFIGTNGREVCRMSGTPKNIAAFEKRAENAEVVEIGRYFRLRLFGQKTLFI